jgi:hypothetical protein
MAKTRIRRLRNLEAVENLLQGGISGGEFISPLFDMDGKTLIFTSPAAATVTFDTDPEGAQQGLTIRQIIDQIIAGTTAIQVKLIKGSGNSYGLMLVHDVATPSIITLGAGTANAQLGFVDSQTGKIFNPPDGVAPRWLELDSPSKIDGAYIIATEE